MTANPQAPLRPCDDNELQRGLYEAIADACTTDGRRLRDVFHHESLRNIVLQITEGSDVLDKLLERHRRRRRPPVAVATGDEGERVEGVDVGGGAVMTIPGREWLWQLRYVRPEPDRGGKCDDRMLAAGICESYLYLILECTKDEAWRRIKLLRAAIRSRSQQVKP